MLDIIRGQKFLYSSLLSKKIEIKNLQNQNFACCFVWVRNLVSLTLREQHRPRVFENRVLKKIFGPKRDEVTG